MNIRMNCTPEPPERIYERKIWKQEDDDILKELFEVRKIRKWSEISRIMQEQFGISARNGKQCRERYHNHLRGGIKKEKWSPSEQALLIQLHARHGNRWALISKNIPGRTENCVKNMLYSRLRKAIRQLNRFIFVYHRKELKQIKLPFVYRLIEFTQNAYKRDCHLRNEMELEAIRLKNAVLCVELEEGRQMKEGENEAVRKLIEEIHAFKRKNQRFRGNLAGACKQKSHSPNKQAEHTDTLTPTQLAIDNTVKLQEDLELEVGLNFIDAEGEKDPKNSENMNRRCSEGRGLLRMDSLDSNFSLPQAQADLELPIQIDLQFVPLNPTCIFEQWGDLSNAWNPNFYY